jgi:hypothetical protein
MPSELGGAAVQDAIGVALALATALDRLGIAYLIGGSLASSVQGEPRATNDIDFVVELLEEHVPDLMAALGRDFEADPEALGEAIRHGSSSNIFHLPSMTKLDLFIRRDAPFDRSEFSRRQSLEVRPGVSLSFKSPEDTVLRKLLWFVSGGQVSSVQWRDVVEVLRVSGPTMDAVYLAQWSANLGIQELLARAQREAGAA